jgi:hypothetical protein
MLQDADGQDLPSNFEKGVRESSAAKPSRTDATATTAHAIKAAEQWEASRAMRVAIFHLFGIFVFW